MAELDPEAEALLDAAEKRKTPPLTTLSIETIRRLGEEFLAVGDPEPVAEVLDFELAGPEADIPIRIYVPDTDETPSILCHFHGGGWVRGSIETSDGVCRILANESGCTVVSVGYRRAPEHPFPAALRDCYHVTKWCQEHGSSFGADPDSIALIGSSAGGNIAAAVSLLASDHNSVDIDHQTLIYPVLNPPGIKWYDSYDENGEGYFLTMEKMEWFIDQYVPDQFDRRNAYAFPLLASDLSNMPATTVVTGGYDPLRDEALAFVDRLESAAVPVTHEHFAGQIHGFVTLYEFIGAGRSALSTVSSEIAAFV